MREVGHYCLPEEAEVRFNPLSRQIEQEFLALLKGRQPAAYDAIASREGSDDSLGKNCLIV